MMIFKNTLVGLIAGAVTLFAANAVEKHPVKDAGKLQEMARSAKTQAEHLEVARLFEAQAEAFDAKAKLHETEMDKLSRRTSYNPMSQKWPAMAQGPVEFQRANAMQARRAAHESRERVAYHRDQAGLAVAGAAGAQ